MKDEEKMTDEEKKELIESGSFLIRCFIDFLKWLKDLLTTKPFG